MKISFAMVGSQKCGTTTCWYEFNKHPQVFMDNGRWFRKPEVPDDLSAMWNKLAEDGGNKSICGLMYPDFALDHCGEAFLNVFGRDLKILALVRDPVHRAVSNYWMEHSFNKEHRPIEEALRTDEPFHYLRRGFYHEHLMDMLKYFPKENILIERTEVLDQKFPKMLSFIGAQPAPLQQRHRVGQYEYDLPKDLEDELYALYAESNRRLLEDFGVNTQSWKPSCPNELM